MLAADRGAELTTVVGGESTPLLPENGTTEPVSCSAIIYEFLIARAPAFILTRFIRTLVSSAIFIMVAMKHPELLPSIGIISSIAAALSGIISAPTYGTNIEASSEKGKIERGTGNKENLKKIQSSGLGLMTDLGVLATGLTLTASLIMFHYRNNATSDTAIFFLVSSTFPLFSAWYNSTASYLQGIKKEKSVMNCNFVAGLATIGLCYYLMFEAKLKIMGAAIAYLSRSFFSFLITTPYIGNATKNMWKAENHDFRTSQWNKSKYMALLFLTEFLMPVSTSIIIRAMGAVPSSAYALFSFYKLLVGNFVYGLMGATRSMTSNYYKRFKGAPNIATDASKKIAIIGMLSQLFITGVAQYVAMAYGRNFLNLLAVLHENKTQTEIEMADKIMPLFSGITIVDSLRLSISSTLNGRDDVVTPAIQSLILVGILGQAALWTAWLGFECSMETIAYITYAAFGLNAITLGMAFKADIDREKTPEQRSLSDKACSLFSFRPEPREPNTSPSPAAMA
jgi:Na+-driven multidrug efflux pump